MSLECTMLESDGDPYEKLESLCARPQIDDKHAVFASQAHGPFLLALCLNFAHFGRVGYARPKPSAGGLYHLRILDRESGAGDHQSLKLVNHG